MPKASVTRLIERDKDKLINFVLDIERYPEFIPFCLDSKIYERKGPVISRKNEKDLISVYHHHSSKERKIKRMFAFNLNIVC